jgi:presenilin-like A22 family membrane protease
MKHSLKITFVLLAMFLVTQFIGLAVQHADVFHLEMQNPDGTIELVQNPYLSWIQPPEVETQTESASIFIQIIIAFIFAILLLFLLSKFKVKFFLKLWFFIVVIVALFLCFYAFEKLVPFVIPIKYSIIIPFALAIPLAFIKIYKKNFLVHNATELLVYPGIAAVFVPLLVRPEAITFLGKVWPILALLIVISLYDAWAVWHSGFMQKMAKYQIDELQIFSGFFVPYASKKVKDKIKKWKSTLSKKELKKKKIKVNIAILGGGDVIFPIITAGVFYAAYGLAHALFVIAGATLGLSYLLFLAKKKKFYPAMPFITAGIFLGVAIGFLF